MRSIILFSGGLDSTVILALAVSLGKTCFPLSFSYGQKHSIELKAAEKIAAYYQVPFNKIEVKLPWKTHSTLTSVGHVPRHTDIDSIIKAGIPSTYVPARNTLFLAYAAGFAESLEADEIWVGYNNMDVNYPDCRPSFLQAFQNLLNHATKQSTLGNAPRLYSPLIDLDKHAIVQLGRKLNAPLEMSWSCYDPQGELPCRVCDTCMIRSEALRDSLNV